MAVYDHLFCLLDVLVFASVHIYMHFLLLHDHMPNSFLNKGSSSTRSLIFKDIPTICFAKTDNSYFQHQAMSSLWQVCPVKLISISNGSPQMYFSCHGLTLLIRFNQNSCSLLRSYLKILNSNKFNILGKELPFAPKS